MKEQRKGRTVSLMGYVVIAVLILAAIAVAIWYFGAQTCAMLGVAGDAACGSHRAAREACEQQRSTDCAGKAAADSDNRWYTESRDERFTDAADKERSGRQDSDVRQSMVTPVPLPDDGGETPSEAFGR